MTERTSITDVPGIRVGQVQRVGEGWLTGVTVVLPPVGTVGGVDVRGGGPGTHETDALDPRAFVSLVDAVVLTGGSAYGLVAAHGAQRWCAQNHRGYRVGDAPEEVVPIVPAASIYDLGRGGTFHTHPTEQMGFEAALAAAISPEYGPVERGTVGAGTGAAIVDETFKGGVGSASVRLPAEYGDVLVGALVVVNSFGRPLQGQDLLATPSPATFRPGAHPPLNTTLAVVATNARLDPAQTSRMASTAHDGFARALDPVHTLADGDTIFALATGEVLLPGDTGRSADLREYRDGIIAVQASAAEAVRLAVRDAVASATVVRTPATYLPRYPLS
jgi:L-aminopeptidase/D-esterase-like protein